MRLSDGTYDKAYAKIYPVNGRIIWVSYACYMPDMSNPRYLTKKENSEEIINMGDYSPKRSGLVFYVVISTAGLTVKPPIGFNDRLVKFTNFNITLFWCFHYAPSLNAGNNAVFATFTENKYPDGSVFVNKPKEGSKSKSPKEARSLIFDTLVLFVNAYHKRAEEYLGHKIGGEDLPLLSFYGEVALNFDSERDARILKRARRL